ncbi:MAG TPA: isoprenylcysteine carboxylmethyltransferase family protein [Candidatus Acidoferrales bacterium]|nr:isoprenylcysteine carboxylmethyltransferase family protein [Candidatus Acidoferrales bacterium]
MISLSHFPVVARIWVILCWCAWLLLFRGHQKPAKEASVRRAPASRTGIALQAVSFAVLFAPRWAGFAYPALPGPLMWVSCILVMLVATASVWMVAAARRVLGKQWSYEARLVEGHQLVVAGPYSHVRHPIYTAMLGMLLATGLAFSVWWGLLAALVIHAAGTAIRIHAEERLLREVFGDDFEAYRRYVPAVIPRWKT